MCDGQSVVVWAEGTGWQRGGDLAWQVFDKSGKATEQPGRVERGHPGVGIADGGGHGRRLCHHPRMDPTRRGEMDW